MNIDLTQAVEAAARVVIREAYPLHGWGDLTPAQQHRCRELVLPIVTAAAPLIEAAVREQVARGIEARGADFEKTALTIGRGALDDYDQGALDAVAITAAIARGGA